MEFAVSVIFTCTEEIVQDFIVIGCTYEMTYRQTHFHCVPASEDVAEVTCGNNNVDFITKAYFALVNKVAVS